MGVGKSLLPRAPLCRPLVPSGPRGPPPSAARVARHLALGVARERKGLAVRVPRRAGGARPVGLLGAAAVVAVLEVPRLLAQQRRTEERGVAGVLLGRGRRTVARVAVAAAWVGRPANARVDPSLVRDAPLPAAAPAHGLLVQAPRVAVPKAAETAAGAPAPSPPSPVPAGDPTVVATGAATVAVDGPPRASGPLRAAMVAALAAPLPSVIVRVHPRVARRRGPRPVAITVRSGPAVRPLGPFPAPPPVEAPGRPRSQAAVS